MRHYPTKAPGATASPVFSLVKFCALCGSLCVVPATRAQQATAPDLLAEARTHAPETLPQLLHQADTTSRTLRIASSSIRRSQAEATQSRLYPNPTLGYQGEQIRGGSFHGGEQGGFLSQTIPLGRKLALRADVAAQQAHAAEASFALLTRTLHNQIAEAFFAALATQQAIPVREALLANANEAAQTAHQLANIGQADLASILQAEIDAQQSAIDLEHAQRLYLQQFATLTSLAGSASLTLTTLTAPTQDITSPTLDLATNPTLDVLTRRLTTAEARLTSVRRESIPDLNLTAGLQQNLEALPEVPGKATGLQAFASASITLPLWNRNQGNIAAAQADVDRAREDLTRTRLLLEQHAETIRQALLSARFESTRLRTELLPRATRAHQLSLDAYNAMASPYAPVLAAQHTLLMLQLRLITVQSVESQSAYALTNLTLDAEMSPMSATDPMNPMNPMD